MGKLVIVDDESNILKILSILFKSNGFDVHTYSSGEEILLSECATNFDVAILDLQLPGISGIDLMDKLKKVNKNAQFIFITAHGDFKTAVEAIKRGAYNFISKPFDNDELVGYVNAAMSIKNLYNQLDSYENQIDPFAKIIGQSSSLKKVVHLAEKAAMTDITLLVTGESGTGKELFVRAIHEKSDRAKHPFIAVNCSAIPGTLFESEFFGHKKGSFTGALNDRKGKFIEAGKGTLFLDEVGEIPMEFQAKLLRSIEYGEITPLGDNKIYRSEARIVAATNKNLQELVKEGKFREDLFYRLNIININIPPLKDRTDDVRLLAIWYAKNFGAENISDKAMKLLTSYHWPGNIRELKNQIQRASILCNKIIQPEDLTLESNEIEISGISHGFNLEEHINNYEKNYILKAMEISGNNKIKAAEILGLTYRVFNYKYDKYVKEN
ncbi:MAG: sigma-54-dependent Fis family transcriptional regulator [Candidatus Delongbacteria bacterium]|nr:sigma-54-dependent Fis family transcriptional regulator [Candidatus Delongbacteria bacterium]MBN2834713.1 sigma-54-dependent Fis family transcriptional regulator [Candidatus Delongbacteria bacterium]